LDRNLGQLIEQQFDQVQLEAAYARQWPKVVGYIYNGVATKP
jgi:hypothetical protein